MKIIYSHLKKFLPDLNKPFREVANTLTMLGHFSDGIYDINGEEVISLEIRQNRGDCLGYYGIARDLAVYYSLSIKLFSEQTVFGSELLPVEVKANKEVKRLQAVKISELKNSPTPDWLKQFLELHSINSINTLVDLTNFIMLWYGIPCHAFDTQKSTDHLIWEINNKTQELITLDGTKLSLPVGTLQISNDEGPVCLSMIGGQNSGIELETKETLIEMAVYDRVRVRKDSRSLKVITEAGIRLEKDLDPELLPQAFNHLIQIILENCGGQATTKLFDYYPQKLEQPKIYFNLQQPTNYSGIDIPEQFALDCIQKLGCQFEKHEQQLIVIPPSIRKDIEIEEDLIEEVIRFYGYDKIPTDQPISSKNLPDITPKILYLINQAKNILISLGYDEIRSWPLIEPKYIVYRQDLPPNNKEIFTENNINASFPLLRTSIISSLLNQKEQFSRFKVDQNKFFEIGKVYYQVGSEFKEHYSLGLYCQSAKILETDIIQIAKDFAIDLNYFQQVYRDQELFYEINLEEVLKAEPKFTATLLNTPLKSTAVEELTKQIIFLDANLFCATKIEPITLLEEYKNKIGSNKLWDIVITDIFEDKKGFKYTFRVSYFNLTDKEAKQVHKKTFEL